MPCGLLLLLSSAPFIIYLRVKLCCIHKFIRDKVDTSPDKHSYKVDIVQSRHVHVDFFYSADTSKLRHKWPFNHHFLKVQCFTDNLGENQQIKVSFIQIPIVWKKDPFRNYISPLDFHSAYVDTLVFGASFFNTWYIKPRRIVRNIEELVRNLL